MNNGLDVYTTTHLLDDTPYPQVFLCLGDWVGNVPMCEPINAGFSFLPKETADYIGRHLLRNEVVLTPDRVELVNKFVEEYF